MTHTDQMRQMIVLLESHPPTSEGAIQHTDYTMTKFGQLLQKWQDKVQGLETASDSDGNWSKFLERNGQPQGTLRDVNDSARALAQCLLDLQMEIQQGNSSPED
jgi:hypothetical protein